MGSDDLSSLAQICFVHYWDQSGTVRTSQGLVCDWAWTHHWPSWTYPRPVQDYPWTDHGLISDQSWTHHWPSWTHHWPVCDWQNTHSNTMGYFCQSQTGQWWSYAGQWWVQDQSYTEHRLVIDSPGLVKDKSTMVSDESRFNHRPILDWSLTGPDWSPDCVPGRGDNLIPYQI